MMRQVPSDRLQHLEMLETQAALDRQTIHVLHAQVKTLDDALKAEQARGEKHADALTLIARACDDRARDQEAQHAAAFAKLQVAHDATVTALRASHTTALDYHVAATVQLRESVAQRDAAIVALHSEIAALKSEAASKLSEMYTAVTALQTLEIHPVRPDQRQFAVWHAGPVPALPLPQPPTFDRAWCGAVAANGWQVDLDATGARAVVVQMKLPNTCLTLRSTAPLPPRPPVPAGAAAGLGHQPSPSCRVIIEAHGGDKCSRLGFLPSHGLGIGAVAAPIPGKGIFTYRGWYILVRETSSEPLNDADYTGWVGLPPLSAAAGRQPVMDNYSVYATTTVAPPVPAGSAVEFAVDYARGTCRVAFFTPAAVAGGFVVPPHAKMELRFVTREGRSLPTAVDSLLELYPAVETRNATGAAWRFV